MANEEKRQHVSDESQGVAPAKGGLLPSTEFREAIPSPEEEIHLRDYLDVIFRRKWLIISFLVLNFSFTTIFTLKERKIYRAETTVEISAENPKITKFQAVVDSYNTWQTTQFMKTQVGLMTSDTLAKRVIDKMKLAEDPVVNQILSGEEGNRGVISSIKWAIASLLPKKKDQNQQPHPVPKEVLEQQSWLGFIKGNLSVSPDRDSMLIKVYFTSPDRKLSRDVVNTLTNEFIQWDMERKVAASRVAFDFLTKQIELEKIDLEKAEEDLNRFASKSGIASLDTNLNSVYRQLEELNSALAEAAADLISKKALYDQAVKDGPASLPQVLNNQMISSLKAEYARLRSEYEDQMVTFHDEYPSVKALKMRMNSLVDRITDEETKVFLAIKGQYEAAIKKAEGLDARAERQKHLAVKLNERATQYKIMERQVETNKSIYQSLLERAKEIKTMAGVSATNIHITDPASLPIFPCRPRVRHNLMLAIITGLIGGFGLAFLLEYFADTINNPEEISQRFQIPILGVAPLAKENEYPVEKTFVNDPRGLLPEALRVTMVSIQLSRADNHLKSFLITSVGQGEGKTTLAANLAQAFAQANEKVVVVDADLRQPRIHKIFNGNSDGNERGLSTLLAGLGDANPIHRSDIFNLDFIPSGPIPPNPVELLTSNRFPRLMNILEKHYDRIILDSPPTQGIADVMVLSRHVGGVVLVTCPGETSREAIRHFKREMLNINSTILGCIINKIDFTKRKGRWPYYKYCKPYYGYGHGREAKHPALNGGNLKQL